MRRYVRPEDLDEHAQSRWFYRDSTAVWRKVQGTYQNRTVSLGSFQEYLAHFSPQGLGKFLENACRVAAVRPSPLRSHLDCPQCPVPSRKPKYYACDIESFSTNVHLCINCPDQLIIIIYGSKPTGTARVLLQLVPEERNLREIRSVSEAPPRLISTRSFFFFSFDSC